MLNLLLTAGSGLTLAAWLVALVRLIQGQGWRYEWGIPEPISPDSGLPPVSIIVPARNEEDTLPSCLPTLLEQSYPEFEVIVVNDRSTDRTEEILRGFEEPNLRIVSGEPRPDESWQGKPWAAHQGAQRARYDWLLFTDADMKFHENLLSGVMETASDHPDTLHTLFPSIRCPGIVQKMLVPLLGLFLMILYPLRFINDPNRSEALAAGGFMLFSRELYEKVGGHRGVRHTIAEDRELARRVKSSGNKIWIRISPDLETVMYRSTRETVEGLTKHLLEGLENRVFLLLSLEVGLVVTHLLPLIALFPGFGMSLTSWVLFGLAMMLAHLIGMGVHHRMPHSFGWGLTLLPGLVLYAGLGLVALYQHVVHGGPRWKERQLSSADRLEV